MVDSFEENAITHDEKLNKNFQFLTFFVEYVDLIGKDYVCYYVYVVEDYQEKILDAV